MGTAKEIECNIVGKKITACHDTGVYRLAFEAFKSYPGIDYSFKLGEEFSVMEPLQNVEIKGVATMCGNVMNLVYCTKGMVLKNKVTFTDNFALSENVVVGTDIVEKLIAVKI